LATPASPSALAAALRVSRSQTASAVASNRDPILSSTLQRSSRVLTSTEASPGRRLRRRLLRGRSPGLSFPSTHAGEEGPLSAGESHSPAAFRLQGLATLVTACSPRRLIGFVSSRQRSWDYPLRSFRLPGGGLGFPPKPDPRRFPATYSGPPKRTGRTSRPRLLGFGPPPEFRGPPQVFIPRHTGGSLGVFPLQGSAAGRLAAGSRPRAPLTRFAEAARGGPAGDLGYRSATD